MIKLSISIPTAPVVTDTSVVKGNTTNDIRFNITNVHPTDTQPRLQPVLGSANADTSLSNKSSNTALR
jgi:hypothetical protein